MGVGAVCHTLNPRLFAADLEYIVNHGTGARGVPVCQHKSAFLPPHLSLLCAMTFDPDLE